MTPYPLLPVPVRAGLYSLTNERTGEIYIGKAIDLRRRHQEWRAVFTNSRGHKSERLARAVTDATEWMFNIIVAYDTIEPKELAKLETAAIKAAMVEYGDRLLNTIGADQRLPCTEGSCDILDEFGERMTYAEVAKRLSCRPKSVSKRMRKYRDRGELTVLFSHLQEMTEAFRNSGP